MKSRIEEISKNSNNTQEMQTSRIAELETMIEEIHLLRISLKDKDEMLQEAKETILHLTHMNHDLDSKLHQQQENEVNSEDNVNKEIIDQLKTQVQLSTQRYEEISS